MDRFPELEIAFSSTRAGAELALRIRPFGEDDIPAVTRACADALSQRWLPLPRPYTREDAAMWIAGHPAQRASGDGVQGAVTLLESDTVVGAVGLTRTDWRRRVTEVGYWAVPEHRGSGYITAATRALSTWTLREAGMERVELLAAPENVASNRVALGAGFRFEGLKRDAGVIDGRRVDMNLYAR